MLPKEEEEGRRGEWCDRRPWVDRASRHELHSECGLGVVDWQWK
jgi:hypothetical protein